MEGESGVLSLVGFAVLARGVTLGVPLTVEALRGAPGKRPLVVLEASDTSENTHKRLCDKTSFYGVPCCRLAVDCAGLAHAVGKRDGALGAVGITEPHLAAEICKKLQLPPIQCEKRGK